MRREKPIQQKQKPGIVTLLNDTTLTKVTYGKYATRVPMFIEHFFHEGVCTVKNCSIVSTENLTKSL